MGRTEAQAAFGNPEMFMERYCQRPRHIEIQVIGDKHGHYTHLGERECSIQRRHQKVIEESPSLALPRSGAREDDGRVGQRDRGDRLHERRHDGVPARRRRQLLLHGDEHAAAGRAPGDRARHRPRSRARADPHRRGRAAVVLRRAPTARSRDRATRQRGRSEHVRAMAGQDHRGRTCPAGSVCVWIRTCTPATSCRRITTRCSRRSSFTTSIDAAAIRRARRCLEEIVIEGPRTNIPFLRRIINHPDFIKGDFDTGFVGRMLAERASAA